MKVSTGYIFGDTVEGSQVVVMWSGVGGGVRCCKADEEKKFERLRPPEGEGRNESQAPSRPGPALTALGSTQSNPFTAGLLLAD